MSQVVFHIVSDEIWVFCHSYYGINGAIMVVAMIVILMTMFVVNLILDVLMVMTLVRLD